MASQAIRSSTPVCRSSFRFASMTYASRLAICPNLSQRSFSTTVSLKKGIMPDTEDPAKPLTETEQAEPTAAVADITEQEYHEIADEYLDNVVNRFEEIQDEREDIDVEFSVHTASQLFP
jgi:frataxin